MLYRVPGGASDVTFRAQKNWGFNVDFQCLRENSRISVKIFEFLLQDFETFDSDSLPSVALSLYEVDVSEISNTDKFALGFEIFELVFLEFENSTSSNFRGF